MATVMHTKGSGQHNTIAAYTPLPTACSMPDQHGRFPETPNAPSHMYKMTSNRQTPFLQGELVLQS